MDTFDLLVKAWPILFALITLIIVLSKLDLRVAVIEEKIKTLFDLINKKGR
jgi:hypothetical protein